MILMEEQIEAMREAAKPLVKFLNENCHPHVIVIVDSTGAEALEGIATVRVEELLRD